MTLTARIPLVAIVLTISVGASPAAAQGRLGARPYSPWGPTGWSFLDLHTKCEGYLPFTGNTPTAWRIQLRNAAEEQVSVDVTASVAGRPETSVTRRLTLKPKGTKDVLLDLDTECGGSIMTRLDKLRKGPDTSETPYAPPDRP